MLNEDKKIDGRLVLLKLSPIKIVAHQEMYHKNYSILETSDNENGVIPSMPRSILQISD